MPAWLDRVQSRVDAMGTKRVPTKAFVQPPFWSQGYNLGETYGGGRVALSTSSVYGNEEAGTAGYDSVVQHLFQDSTIVASCVRKRVAVFSQGRFQRQRMRRGRPGDYWPDPSLALLDRPWLSGSVATLLSRMEMDVSFAGNCYLTIVDSEGNIGLAHNPEDPNRYIARMRPDWVTLVIDSPSGQLHNVDATVVGLIYRPPGLKDDPVILTRREFAHYMVEPDPSARFRGMSWITTARRDIAADCALTDHTEAFLKNGATPNIFVRLDEIDEDDFKAFVKEFRRDYEGARNAYKTLFINGGADVTPLSIDFRQLEAKALQDGGETRITAASGVPPAIAGFSEGLQGSALNSGNFDAARRLFVDSTIRDLWTKAAPAVEVLFPSPRDSRLWIDTRDIPFLRDDAQSEANTFLTQMNAINVGITAGFGADAMVRAAKAADVDVLIGEHTGLVSVQLQEPGAQQNATVDGRPDTMPTLTARANGNGRPAALAER